MPLTRSSKRKLLRGENNDKTSGKSKLPNNERSQKQKKKLPNNERSQKRKKGTASLKGLLPGPGLYPPYYVNMFMNIPREENQDNSSEEYSEPWNRSQPIFLEEEDQYEDYDTGKEIAESALCEYNNRHGTDLELVRFLDANERDMFGPGARLDFADGPARWRHMNIVARRRSVDPEDENSLFLFVESISSPTDKYDLLTLLLVAPTDNFNGCQKCWSFISHPRYGFRAGFTKNPPRRSTRYRPTASDLNESAEKIRSVASDPKLLSEDDAVKLSQFALKDYNEKHGTNLKFERAFGCNSFTCAGRLMDFTEKSTRWVHVNFEAMVGVGSWESIRLMFAELYLGNDDKYVLATLLPAEPEVQGETCGRWRDGYPESECAICPSEIRHPWRAYRYCFNLPPKKVAWPVP